MRGAAPQAPAPRRSGVAPRGAGLLERALTEVVVGLAVALVCVGAVIVLAPVIAMSALAEVDRP